ncbi:MAG: glycosyltransferase family 1 protein [Prevotella sp.]|nr:glycosyltransferase family 1 protein [Prevotella sp.]
MRILLLGEYSNVHATLAEGLREKGHEVTVVSNGDFWKDYPRDIDVSRKEGRLGGIRLLVRVYSILHRLRGYDIVQLINPMFLELKAQRLFKIYRYLRQHNKCIVLCAMGMDYYWVHECIHSRPLRYSDFNIGPQLRTDPPALEAQRDWLDTAKERLNTMMADDCDAIVSGLYENHVCYLPHFPQKLHFIPLPIKPQPSPTATAPTDRLRLFIGISRGRSSYKGTDIMLQAAEAIMEKYPGRVELRKAEGVPFCQYQHMMDHSDAILDQLYSYTPSMNPLLAMSKGIVCIGGGEPENYEILNEEELRPIINVSPTYDSVFHELERLVLHPELLPQLKQQGIAYISRHHDYLKVAAQYEELYKKLVRQ